MPDIRPKAPTPRQELKPDPIKLPPTEVATLITSMLNDIDNTLERLKDDKNSEKLCATLRRDREHLQKNPIAHLGLYRDSCEQQLAYYKQGKGGGTPEMIERLITTKEKELEKWKSAITALEAIENKDKPKQEVAATETFGPRIIKDTPQEKATVQKEIIMLPHDVPEAPDSSVEYTPEQLEGMANQAVDNATFLKIKKLDEAYNYWMTIAARWRGAARIQRAKDEEVKQKKVEPKPKPATESPVILEPAPAVRPVTETTSEEERLYQDTLTKAKDFTEDPPRADDTVDYLSRNVEIIKSNRDKCAKRNDLRSVAVWDEILPVYERALKAAQAREEVKPKKETVRLELPPKPSPVTETIRLYLPKKPKGGASLQELEAGVAKAMSDIAYFGKQETHHLPFAQENLNEWERARDAKLAEVRRVKKPPEVAAAKPPERVAVPPKPGKGDTVKLGLPIKPIVEAIERFYLSPEQVGAEIKSLIKRSNKKINTVIVQTHNESAITPKNPTQIPLKIKVYVGLFSSEINISGFLENTADGIKINIINAKKNFLVSEKVMASVSRALEIFGRELEYDIEEQRSKKVQKMQIVDGKVKITFGQKSVLDIQPEEKAQNIQFLKQTIAKAQETMRENAAARAKDAELIAKLREQIAKGK